MIQVSGLTKAFADKKRGTFRAVDSLSFEVRDGEIFGLLGPNGAGKTTLLRLLSTAIKPTSGTATLGGYDLVKEDEQVRKLLGVLPAGAGLYGRLTARENLRYFGKLHGMQGEKLEKRITALLTRLELGENMDRRTEGFSTGMQQKVALARTILHDPPICFMDEPTEGLDVPTARIVYEMVEELKAEGKCVIFSTHRMEEAVRLCDEIGVIAFGKLRAMGTVAELRRQAGIEDMEEVFMRLVGERV